MSTGASPGLIPPAARPTVLLVHGAFEDGSVWRHVIAGLQGRGYEAVAIATPLRGLWHDAGYVAQIVAAHQGPVILAGHAYGGAVITVAGAAGDEVTGLVYVAGFALDEDESCLDVMRAAPGPLAEAILPSVIRDEAAGNCVELGVRRTAFAEVLAGDLSTEESAIAAASQRPVAPAAFEEAAPAAAWRAIPSVYVVATADRSLHPDAQRRMARRAGSRLVEVNASNAAPVSRPGAVIEAILRADRRNGPGGP